MGDELLGAIPAVHRETAAAALDASGIEGPTTPVAAVTGGASGALTYRVEDGDRSLLLRIETARDLFRDPARTYPCLVAASDAGIAPKVHHADASAGVAIMDLITTRPLDEHPGGAVGIIRELGTIAARLQTTPCFPPLLGSYAELLSGMLTFVAASDVFAPGVLQPVVDRFEALRAAYPWEAFAQVSAHNDLNERNLLFDGERLWVVDWELAFRADPLADVATVANNLAPAADLVDELLLAWSGSEPDIGLRHRLTLMRQCDRVFYGCLILSQFGGQGHRRQDLSALTPDELRAEVESGRLPLASADLMHALGMMNLAAFVTAFETAEVEEAMSTVSAAAPVSDRGPRDTE
jgi:hypothetical protein